MTVDRLYGPAEAVPGYKILPQPVKPMAESSLDLPHHPTKSELRNSRQVAISLAARPWLTNAVLAALGFALLLLTRQLVQDFDHVAIGFTTLAAWSILLYAVAAVLVLIQPVNRFTFAIILAVAIACRLVTVLPEPYLSSDIYRYAWDGVVQHAHISPYRYVPGDSALSFLRAPNQDLYDNINRRDYAHTIYPPGAQFLFFLITFLNPSVTFMKLAMILFEGLTLYALTTLFVSLGARREQSLLYAWCPLLIWEIGSSGHLDSAAMAFMALALLARFRRQPIATGAFLGFAILIKLYPLILFPALFRRGEFKMPATAASVIALGYAAYASVGWQVFGFLGGYVKEENIQSGERYFFLELAHRAPGLHALPAVMYFIFCGVVYAGLIAWCWHTCCSPGGNETVTDRFGLPRAANFVAPAFALAFVSTLLFSPHYAWYIAWLVPFLTLMPNLTAMVYICGLFYGSTTTLIDGAGPTDFMLDQALYSSVLAALVIELGLRLYRPWFKTGSELS